MHATKIVVLSLGLVIGVHVTSAQAEKWDLRRVTTSAVCHVQKSDSAPPLGVQVVKSYDSRKDACEAAKKQYDSSMSDPKKCWTYGSGTKKDCKDDKVDL